MSVLGYGFAGALQGAGQGLKEQAIAKREVGMELVRQRFALSRDQANREFQRSEREASERFTAEQNAAKLESSKAPKPTNDIKEYEAAKSQGYEGTFMEYQMELKKAGATNINMNNEQSKAAGFADRMLQSEQILRRTEDAGTSLTDRSLDKVPVFGNYMTSDDFKSFEQAKRDFVNAILRRESGAVISASEFDNADKQYFPQPGDTEEVIAQKRKNRQSAIEGIVRAAGPTYQPALIPEAQEETEQPESTEVKIPEVGAVEQGYRFKGGNPADKNNWEKVQ